jgi:hypothetical protein
MEACNERTCKEDNELLSRFDNGYILLMLQNFLSTFAFYNSCNNEILLKEKHHILKDAKYELCPRQLNCWDCGLFTLCCFMLWLVYQLMTWCFIKRILHHCDNSYIINFHLIIMRKMKLIQWHHYNAALSYLLPKIIWILSQYCFLKMHRNYLNGS